jgi:hypothetical protein
MRVLALGALLLGLTVVLLRGLERHGSVHVRSDRAGDPAYPGRVPLGARGDPTGPARALPA